MVEPQSFVEGLRSELEGDSAAPLYHRLIKGFHRAMGEGTLGIDVALPSERDSETFLGVSWITVRRAVRGLVEEGLLSQRQGAGTFVLSRVEQPLTELTGYREDMTAWGMAPDVHGEHNRPIVQNFNLISAPITMIQSFYLFANSLSLARGMNPNAPEHLRKVVETT